MMINGPQAQGPTGTKPGGGADNKEPSSGDFKAWCDWNTNDKIFGGGFFSSTLFDAASWAGDLHSGNSPTSEDTEADGTPVVPFILPAGLGNGKMVEPSRVGNAPVRFGFWPNSMLVVGYVAKWTFDKNTIAAPPGNGYNPYDNIRGTRHGFSSFTHDPGFFCGMHGGWISRLGWVNGASNPFYLTCGVGYVSQNDAGTFMTSTVPLVSDVWYRVLVARNAVNTYFKVNSEPWQSSPSIYEPFPLQEAYRVPRFIGEQIETAPQVASAMRLSTIYTARGVQR